MINLTLPDGSRKSFPAPVTLREIAESIGPRLARAAVAGLVDGRPCDLAQRVERDAAVRLLTLADPEGLDVMRHTAAHVMAEAILRLWPKARLAIGPTIEDGFYYDVDLETPISVEDLPRVEAEMKQIVAADRPLVRSELPRAQAREKVEAEGNPYKLANLDAAEGDAISFYRQGDGFEDLCRGPHLPSTGRVGPFKLLSVAGAYWRGDSKNKQLQRLYGTAWPDAKALKTYLDRLEEAKKRDHRRLGQELDLYSIQEEIGPGLILWHPKGALVRQLIEDFWRQVHAQRGYLPVYTPHIASEKIYQVSGHLEKYAEMMYSPMDIDGAPYRAKPMNCPGHILIYKSQLRSYRDLPIRYCELGTVYRYEPSGTLHGMLRVRGFTQDDAHIFCTPEQLAGEVAGVLDLVDLMMTRFGYTYKTFLATRPAKYLGTPEEWERSTAALREALERRGQAYQVDEGGGVFYAPKIDLKLVDSLGREWQGPTIQVDLNLPKRFDVTYVGADNARHEAIMIHRAVLGSMERFVGGLIEHYAGAFPLWLAPVQVRVASLADRHIPATQALAARLREAGYRVEEDLRNEKLGYKVREWSLAKIPYLLMIGDREAESGRVAVRVRGAGDAGTLGEEELLARLAAERRATAAGGGPTKEG